MEFDKLGALPTSSADDKDAAEFGVKDKKSEASWKLAVEQEGSSDGSWASPEHAGDEVRTGLDVGYAGDITTMAVGEEGGGGDDGIAEHIEANMPEFGDITTMAVGEEGDGGDDGGSWNSYEDGEKAPTHEFAPFRPGEITTAAVGEEGGSEPGGAREALKDLLDGREKIVEADDVAPDDDRDENVDGVEYTNVTATSEEVSGKMESVREFLAASSKEELFERLKELFGDPIFDSLREKDDAEEAPQLTQAIGEDGGGISDIGATTLAIGEEGGSS